MPTKTNPSKEAVKSKKKKLEKIMGYRDIAEFKELVTNDPPLALEFCCKLEDFIASLLQQKEEEVIEYIANHQGWEESGDIYRKHYGLPIKYPKK